jgi:hypothetical protein
MERGLSVLLGAGLVALGMGRRWRTRLGLAAAGGMLIKRGISGESRVYRTLHIRSV